VTKKKNVPNKSKFDMAKYNDLLVNTDLNVTNLTEKIQNCEKLNFLLCLYDKPAGHTR